ncbi:tetratricopeptide repeat protein [Thalassobaculum sp. OXR-137]|uniref:tetratricopeptide repeat protein n=1 Tax=Thalassobaculum sp. OXR-137 TaxID=3100173 RepID=UPI002AC964CB|nr:tetratricopeptide repeat protein [Thalassobaculum sp. OXR-137]WPZ34187.1 tetratricopeptide repeat protein [Thalassobaculum sp. OXR-137]
MARGAKTPGSGQPPRWADPRNPLAAQQAALIRAGIAAYEAGDVDAARARFRAVLDQDIEHPDALMGMGIVARAMGQHQTAAELLRRSVAVNPRSATAWSNLGNALQDLDLWDDAVRANEEAAKLDPAHPGIRQNLGSVLNSIDRPYQALPHFREALKATGSPIDAVINYATVLSRVGEYGAADRNFKRALKDAPSSPVANFHYGMNQLWQGNWEEGWPLHEWRFLSATYAGSLRQISITNPLPESFEGKRVFLFREQGIGDELRFATMVPDIAARGGDITLECSAKLMPLLARSFPELHLVEARHLAVDRGEEVFDIALPTGSLGQYVRRSREAFPRNRTLLRTDGARVAGFAERLQTLGPGPKVGLSWRSGLRGRLRSDMYASVEDLVPLFRVKGVTFVNLQYDDARAELAQVKDRFGVTVHAFDDLNLFDDLDGSAALTRALDFVVTANTSVATIAGGVSTQGVEFFGRPIPKGYPIDGRDPWFPSIRPMGKRPSEPWSGLMREIAKVLEQVTRRGTVPDPAGDA